MASYEVEHGTADLASNGNQDGSASSRPRRPDMSTFFSSLSEITPDPEHPQHRPHAVPAPGEVRAVFTHLVEALDTMRSEHGSDELLNRMIETLIHDSETPPREIEGVSEEYCDLLERVPKSALTADQSCPICSNPFLEDKFPLVVRLPCHPTHIFDLECVKPWLRLRGTCPLDRIDFAAQQREKAAEQARIAEEDEEEEWDGMYA